MGTCIGKQKTSQFKNLPAFSMGSATRDGEQKISLTHAEVLVMPRSLFQTVGGIDPAKKNNLVMSLMNTSASIATTVSSFLRKWLSQNRLPQTGNYQ